MLELKSVPNASTPGWSTSMVISSSVNVLPGSLILSFVDFSAQTSHSLIQSQHLDVHCMNENNNCMLGEGN